MISKILFYTTVLTYLCISGCATTSGPASIFSSQGTINSDIKNASTGIARLYILAEKASYDKPTENKEAEQMLNIGFSLIAMNCNDYFTSAGTTQKWLIFTRNIIGLAGTVTTGVLALTKSTVPATAAVALTTSTAFAGLDTYTKNFLFASENIESVHKLVNNALSAHIQEVNKIGSFTYYTAIVHLSDNQNICKPMSIAALVREAINKGKPFAEKAAAPAPESAETPAAAVPKSAETPAAPVPKSAAKQKSFYHVTIGIQ